MSLREKASLLEKKKKEGEEELLSLPLHTLFHEDPTSQKV